jgi:uncharacterized protein (DUF2062 family)
MPDTSPVAGFFQRRVAGPLVQLLRQGVTPEKLALSVALGAVVAVIPVLGVSTVACAALAVWLRLNMPAIQVVNYLMTPVQLLLIIPFLRFGERLTGAPRHPVTLESGLTLLSHGIWNAVRILWDSIVHATFGWLVVAPLAMTALYVVFRQVFRHLAPARPPLRPPAP